MRRRAPEVPYRRRAERLGLRGEKCASEGQKMAYSWFKTRLTSRRAGPRRDVAESRIAHVATCGATSRRGREHYNMTSRREIPRRDVTERVTK